MTTANRITNISVGIDGAVPGLRPGDPVEVTVHLPEGDVTVEAWCQEIRLDRYSDTNDLYTRVIFHPIRAHRSAEIIDESDIEAF
jgi:hypothetical protein